MKVSIFTFGCASNKADSNMIESLLQSSYDIVYESKDADIIIINSCTVKGPTEQKIKYLIKSLKQKKHRIVIAGCLISDEKIKKDFAEYSYISPYNIEHIKDLVDYIAEYDMPVHMADKSKNKSLKYLQYKKGINIIPIAIGCLDFCTYCKTKLAKPLFFSYKLDEIIEKAKSFYEKGAYEIWLSSEDNGAYGKDFSKSYIDLLYAIEESFEDKNIIFRFGMANPQHICKKLEETKEFFSKTKAFYKFMHIPIQSASDSVLEKMNRRYNREKLEEIFSELCFINVATDVICGFPNESEDDFLETYNFIAKHKPLVLNISMFWPMPFTKAKEMKQLPTEVKKDRSRRMTLLHRKIVEKKLSSYIGKEMLFYANSFDGKNTLLRSRQYISAIAKNTALAISKWHKLKVKAVENNHLLV